MLTATLALVGGFTSAAQATEWTTAVQGGEVRFDDWGYTGPGGRGAMDFAPINGFGGAAEGNGLDPGGGVGQVQYVITKDPDRLTPDAPIYPINDGAGGLPVYRVANADAQVNFYRWGYTTGAGSTFNNMQIDYDGDYLIKRNDMSFQYYGEFDYQYEGAGNPEDFPVPGVGTAEGVYTTNIGFQPYALSDAIGWCGSVMVDNPMAQQAMAGQITFDFGFDALMPWGSVALQIVPEFMMRSYGTLTIETFNADGSAMDALFVADAVVNNTSPTLGRVPGDPANNMGFIDDAFYNQVSFMGGGQVPEYVWVELINPGGIVASDNIAVIHPYVEGGAQPAGTVLHQNSFANYPFMLRADGTRFVQAFDFDHYSNPDLGYSMDGLPSFAYNAEDELVNAAGEVVTDLSAVPVPAAVWLFGSGLLGLVGVVGRRKT